MKLEFSGESNNSRGSGAGTFRCLNPRHSRGCDAPLEAHGRGGWGWHARQEDTWLGTFLYLQIWLHQ